MAKYTEEDQEDETLDRGDDFLEDEEDEDLEEIEEDQEDEEVDEEEQEEEEDEVEEEEVPTKKEARIPKSRFDEVIQQREDAKERNLWLEAQLEKLISLSNAPTAATPAAPQAPTYDFTAAEEQYVSLIIEGEIAKASALRNQIDKERKNELMGLINTIKSTASTEAKAESTAAIEAERFNNYIATVESTYSFLDTNSKDYNEEAVDTVNALLAGYVASGKTKTEGLKLAISKVVPLYKGVEKEIKVSLGGKRKVEAGKKAAKAASSQPTKVKSASTKSADSETVDISKMSERDFNKLTKKELSILRGD
jgi:DNA-binding CsgD family transcriptional regulator